MVTDKKVKKNRTKKEYSKLLNIGSTNLVPASAGLCSGLRTPSNKLTQWFRIKSPLKVALKVGHLKDIT